MKVFITASFKSDKNKEEIEELCLIAKKAGFDDFCFIRDIENYQKVFSEPRELMNRARNEIKKCDVLLLEATEKSTGRTLEAGIAYAYKKKIIILIKDGVIIKDTIQGIADAVITYNTIRDIENDLKRLYLDWNKT